MYTCLHLPVLSEQMLVALPIVSQAANTLIKHWSLYIFLVEKARAMVTDSGKPSGIATTTITTARMNAEMTDEPTFLPPSRAQMLMMRAMKVTMAAPRPMKPIYRIKGTGEVFSIVY